ncbi:hypothetical protein [Litoribrevibacter albus]|uniref:Uncharacterized protein n=1 Tax=Litoribrevibacter albus TaxID=1473156 RepID=A0AA37SCB6_9GAMM|nr:hypothetical protein [Litoribrevibacter albus]GLQ32198.1 hypothetical protein GCM10007876_26770 [Litoribrevibacter albus]
MKYLQRISWFPSEQKVIFRDNENTRNWISFKSIREIAHKERADVWWCSEGDFEFVMLRSPD